MRAPPACSMQRGMFLLQSMVAIALFSVGALAVVTLSANTKRQAAEAHYRTEASVLVAQLTAQMRLGPRDPGVLGARYGQAGAGYASFSTAAAQVLPGVQSHPPVIAIDGDSNVSITVRWQAPGETTSHQYVAATRIVE